MILPSCCRRRCYSLAVLTLVLGISGALRVYISAETLKSIIKPNFSLKLNLLEKHESAFEGEKEKNNNG